MWVHVQLDSPNDGIGADWSKAGDLEFYGAENRAGNVSSGAAGFFGEQTRRTSGAYTCALLSLRSRYATRLNAGCVGTTQLPHVRRVEEWFRIKRATDFGRVAQLVRAPASHAGGRRFESCRAHHSRTCESAICNFDPWTFPVLILQNVSEPYQNPIGPVSPYQNH